MNYIQTFCLLLVSIFSISNSEPDPNFHIYLAFGQSNMEGQGEIEPQDIANVQSASNYWHL